MDRFSIVALAAMLGSGSVFAGYALPAPPPGFGGSPGNWTMAPAANAPTVGGGSPASNAPTFRGPGPVIPGPAGAGIPTTAAYRLAPGAARALARGAARFLIPGAGWALAGAWLAAECIERQGGSWVLTCGFPTPPQSDGYQYRPVHAFYPGAPVYFPSASQACDDFRGKAQAAYAAQNPSATVTGSEVITCAVGGMKVRVHFKFGTGPAVYADYTSELYRSTSSCPVGWYITPAGCVQNPPPQPITPEEIEERMAPKPLPEILPPGFPYPLDPVAPSIWNPEPLPDVQPGQDPKSRPLRVPQGDPQPVPNTNPQQYRQPMTRWASSPTASDPWRMDVRPEETTGTDPKGIEQPQSETSGSPEGKKPEQFDLCAEHPDIIACQVFKPDELEAKPVPNENKNLAITPDGGWGASTASCPADKTASLSFGPIAFSYEPLCLFANGIRPMVIALAWFSAALTFFGFARKDT